MPGGRPVENDAMEGTPLLPECSHPSPATSAAKAPAVCCRICLEEDSTSNLEQPCACSGTVSFAHHNCVQKWVTAKGNKTCEICKHEYQGDFEVPPAPAPPAQQVHLLGPIRSVYINGDGVIHEIHDMFESEDMFEERRKSGLAWCLTFILFATLLLLLHHSMAMAESDSQHMPPAEKPAPGSEEGISVPMSIFWGVARMMFIALPLYMVMRAAQEARRAAVQAQLQMMRESAPGWGLVFPTALWQAELAHVQQGQQPRGVDNV
jgi:hypothetical protein